MYTLKYIYTYIKETAIRKRTIDMLKNNGSRKHKQLPALKFHVLHFFLFRSLGSRHAFVCFARCLHLTPGGGNFGRAGQPPGSENFYPTHPPLKLKITRVTFTENILLDQQTEKECSRQNEHQQKTNEICLSCFRKFRSQSQRTSENANAEERERSVLEGRGRWHPTCEHGYIKASH